jgi:hypothetical protein
MKRISAAKVLGIALALVVAGAQARATQWSVGNSTQPSRSESASTPAFVGRSNGSGGQPSQLAQFGQTSHSIIRVQPTPTRTVGPTRPAGNRTARFGHELAFGRDRSHFHGHRHLIVVFVNGAPCWYPVYTYYPYGYDVPVDISSSTVSDTSDDGYVPAVNDNGADSGSSIETSEYSDLGLSWGQDLRREVATWDQFVAYLKTYIVTAPASAQADFREAFISAYRLNGATAYDKAAAEAAGIPPATPPGPKIITFPPPPPPSGD